MTILIDGLSAFLTTWSGVHTAYSFNQTDVNTGTDTGHAANSSSYKQKDIDNFSNYGINDRCLPDPDGDMDIYTITDTCMMIYVPDNLTLDRNYGLFHNGGATNAQCGWISNVTGDGPTICISHNTAVGQDEIYHILSGGGGRWYVIGFQFEDNSGNMAIWEDGSNVAEVSRNYNLLYGSGNVNIGDSNGLHPSLWGEELGIIGSGIVIANIVVDNPDSTNTTPPGCGDTFYTDYYDEHTEEFSSSSSSFSSSSSSFSSSSSSSSLSSSSSSSSFSSSSSSSSFSSSSSSSSSSFSSSSSSSSFSSSSSSSSYSSSSSSSSFSSSSSSSSFSSSSSSSSFSSSSSSSSFSSSSSSSSFSSSSSSSSSSLSSSSSSSVSSSSSSSSSFSSSSSSLSSQSSSSSSQSSSSSSSAVWVDQTKHTTTFTPLTKHSTTFIPKNKSTAPIWTSGSKHTTTFIPKNKSTAPVWTEQPKS